jgi:hypothetical protein
MILLLFLLLFASAAGAQTLDPQTAGRAGVHDLCDKGPAAIGWNSAVLGPDRDFKTTWELPGAASSISNNAFSVDYWNSHLAGDRFLTEADKADILAKIPSGGLRGDFQSVVPVVGFGSKRFAARVALENVNEARLPKDFARLALVGDEVNRLYGIGNIGGESQTLLDYGIGFSYQFEQEQIPDLYFGAGFHFYQGLYLAKVAQSEGDLVVTDSLVTGSGVIHTVRSNTGDGVGFDLSALAVLSDKWQVGLAVRQLSTSMTWDVQRNERISFYTDSLGVSVDSLQHAESVKRNLNYYDDHWIGGTVETRLPVIFEVNGRFKAAARWTLLGDATLRTSNSVRGESGLEAGAALEYQPHPVLVLQGGASFGGPWDSQFGLGFGLRFRHYEMDLGGTYNGGLFNAAHGVSVGFSQKLKF